MPEITALAFETIKLVAAGIVGVACKIIYDRKFGKRPDLRYIFQAAAAFGAGDRKRVFQNFELFNGGTETAHDVRVIFSQPAFDLAEHQVIFDGQWLTETINDRKIFNIPALPPKDRITISFTFAPSDVAKRLQDFFVSVRSQECLGQPGNQSSSGMLDKGLAIASLCAFAFAVVVVVSQFTTTIFRERLALNESLVVTRPKELVRIDLQGPRSAAAGTEALVYIIVSNNASSPFAGRLAGQPPWGGSESFIHEAVNVGPEDKYRSTWKVAVPTTILPGKYGINAVVVGQVLDQMVSKMGSTTIEVTK